MAVKAATEVTVYDQTDATALVEWYYTTTSATAPGAPATTDASATPTGWSRAEPSISSDADLAKYAYTCLQTVWGDGTCDWGDVQLSSGFEAAKRAYNRAVAAGEAVNAIEVGGRNLLLATRTAASVVGTSATARYTPEYTMSDYMVARRDTTTPLTISFDWSCDDGNGTLPSGGTMYPQIARSAVSGYKSVSITAGSGHYEITTKLTSAQAAHTSKTARVRVNNLPSGFTFTVSNYKLETGNRATDWTPAPEDVDADISTAAQTATNHISTDSSGIKIADSNPSTATTYLRLASSFLDFVRGSSSMLKAWLDGAVAKVRVGLESGSHVLIDGDGVKLMDGAAMSANFAEDVIELGGEGAEIKMCGDNATIFYDPSLNYHTQITAKGPIAIGSYLEGSSSVIPVASIHIRDNAGGGVGIDAKELLLSGEELSIWPVGEGVSSFGLTDVVNAIPVNLYDNASASASAATTLSETAANFRRMTIFFKDTDGNYSSADVWDPNGKRVALSLTWINGAATQEMYQRVRWVTISGTSISTYKASGDSKYRTGQVKLGATASVTNSDYIAITHVIGYR